MYLLYAIMLHISTWQRAPPCRIQIRPGVNIPCSSLWLALVLLLVVTSMLVQAPRPSRFPCAALRRLQVPQQMLLQLQPRSTPRLCRNCARSLEQVLA